MGKVMRVVGVCVGVSGGVMFDFVRSICEDIVEKLIDRVSTAQVCCCFETWPWVCCGSLM